MSFTTQYGHEALQDTLEMLTTRPPRASLFYGPKGIGKTLKMRQFASMLLRREDETVFQVYERIKAGDQYDYLELAPEGKQGYLTDQIREALAWGHKAPTLGNHRVVLIPNAHLLNVTSASALLKPFEEAPEGLRFLLSTSIEALPLLKPLRARCYPLWVGYLSLENVSAILEQHKLTRETASYYASFSGGVPGRALKFAAHAEVFQTLAEFVVSLDRVSDWQLLRVVKQQEDPFLVLEMLEALVSRLIYGYIGKPVEPAFYKAACRYGHSVFAMLRKILAAKSLQHLSVNHTHQIQNLILTLKETVK